LIRPVTARNIPLFSSFGFFSAFFVRRLITDLASFISFLSVAASSRKVTSNARAPFLSPRVARQNRRCCNAIEIGSE
jgi:hypothetical protein